MRLRPALALAVLIAGSIPVVAQTVKTPPNRGMGSVHQPVVTRTDFVYDMVAARDTLDPFEAGRLTGWFDSLQLRYGDRVSVDTQGLGNGSRDAVAVLAARYGLLLDAIAPMTQGAVAPGSVRVIVSRMAASVLGCPDFSRVGTSELGGATQSNYGCATNATLAAMIADPRDLLSGRDASALGDVTATGKAVRAYRAGTIKSLKNESSKGGN